ncbi:MAG: septum formation protein Maf [Ekhidna sp.]|nr:septum formation protein Maf [Ekhidna sp.]
MKHSNKLILASNSPRRKQLLAEAGFDFAVHTIPGLEEVFPKEMESSEVAEFLAVQKNRPYRKLFSDEIVITADTVVVFEEKILGKPESTEEATQVIQQLSGNTHSVISGVCISDAEKEVSFSSTTEVKFRELSSAEINHYVTKWPPMDKAGSYGIQEWIGLVGVEWIKGSYFNVVGLPVHQVYLNLRDHFQLSL